jgi:hypothetical protein
MKVKVKKLYRGYATVRDYVVEKCYSKGEDLEIEYEGRTTIIENKYLPLYQKMTKKIIKSKFDDSTYSLCDFPFGDQSKNLELFK